VIADPARTIGRSIATLGLYDLAVSEALFRLISPGDLVVDAGANIGYMTVLASLAATPDGRVVSFEPHPTLFRTLTQNVAAIHDSQHFARVEAIEAALGARSGTAELQLPEGFEENDGIGTIGATQDNGPSVTVRVTTLDEAMSDAKVGLLKLDVEGYESQVLHGARRLLDMRRITHIVFEDHAIDRSEVAPIRLDAGYRIFSLGWTMRGPLVLPFEAGSLAAQYEAPNYIATLEPEILQNRFQKMGWYALRPYRQRKTAT